MNAEIMSTRLCGGASYRRPLSLPTKPKGASARRFMFVCVGEVGARGPLFGMQRPEFDSSTTRGDN